MCRTYFSLDKTLLHTNLFFKFVKIISNHFEKSLTKGIDVFENVLKVSRPSDSSPGKYTLKIINLKFLLFEVYLKYDVPFKLQNLFFQFKRLILD